MRAVLAVALALLPLATTFGLLPQVVAQASPQVAVLIYHPVDEYDPFGIPGSPFETRYAHASDAGRFDYPTTVVDGVHVVRAVPDPQAPYASTLQAYDDLVLLRVPEEPPAELSLASAIEGQRLNISVTVTPRALPENAQVAAHLVVALSEDNIFHRPPSPISNGVENHRFTVRAHRNVATVALHNATSHHVSFDLAPGWTRDALSVTAFLVARDATTRYAVGEVLQAVQAPVGWERSAAQRVVLVEMLSATWCDPCLYGDLAVEELAIRYGAASPAPSRSTSYLDRVPILALGLGALSALWIGSRKR